MGPLHARNPMWNLLLLEESFCDKQRERWECVYGVVVEIKAIVYQEDVKAHAECLKQSSSGRLNQGSRLTGASQLAWACHK